MAPAVSSRRSSWSGPAALDVVVARGGVVLGALGGRQPRSEKVRQRHRARIGHPAEDLLRLVQVDLAEQELGAPQVGDLLL